MSSPNTTTNASTATTVQKADALIAEADALEKNAARRGSSGTDDRIKAMRLREEAEKYRSAAHPDIDEIENITRAAVDRYPNAWSLLWTHICEDFLPGNPCTTLGDVRGECERWVRAFGATSITLTDEQAAAIGEAIARDFKLRRPKDGIQRNERWDTMSGDYTNIGIARRALRMILDGIADHPKPANVFGKAENANVVAARDLLKG